MSNFNFTAESQRAQRAIIFLFAAERTANKKTQALRARQKSDLPKARVRINMNCRCVLKFANCLYIFCRRLIVFHLPLLASRFGGASQGQMKGKIFSALFAPAVKNLAANT